LIRQLTRFLQAAIVLAFFAATVPCAFADSFARISAPDVAGVLQVVDGRVEFGPPPANTESADWRFEIAGPIGYRIKNRRSQLYLAQRNGQIVLAANAADNVNLIWQPTVPANDSFSSAHGVLIKY
jgi:hypothetical protein